MTHLKRFLLLPVFIFVALLAIGQVKMEEEVEKGEDNFGLKTGMTMSRYTGDNITGTENNLKPAATLGLGFNHKSASYFWLKHEAFLTIKGAQNDANNKTNLYTADFFPLSPTFHIEGFQVFAGPTATLLITRLVMDDGDLKEPVDPREGYNNMTYGVMGGIEYQFDIGLTLGLRYQRGLTRVRPKEAHNRTYPAFYHQMGYFTVGYDFE